MIHEPSGFHVFPEVSLQATVAQNVQDLANLLMQPDLPSPAHTEISPTFIASAADTRAKLYIRFAKNARSRNSVIVPGGGQRMSA